jgi:SRSO17 transposase
MRFHGRLGPQEWLLALRMPEGEVSHHLAWAPGEVTLEEAVAAHGRRHQIEQEFQHGKGEAGLDHYEARSHVGGHHHMTLSLLALWFLCQDRLEQISGQAYRNFLASGMTDAQPGEELEKIKHECRAKKRGITFNE